MHAFLSKNDQQGHESEPYQITYLGKYQTLTLANHSLPLTEHMIAELGFGTFHMPIHTVSLWQYLL